MKTKQYIIPTARLIELNSAAIALNQVSLQGGNGKYDKETDEGDLVKDAGPWDNEW